MLYLYKPVIISKQGMRLHCRFLIQEDLYPSSEMELEIGMQEIYLVLEGSTVGIVGRSYELKDAFFLPGQPGTLLMNQAT